MNRRNFFGTLGAAVAGLVLGSNVKPAEAGPTLEFVDWGSRLTVDESSSLRLFNDVYREPFGRGELHVRTFIADEVRVGGGAQYAQYWDVPADYEFRWQIGVDSASGDKFKIQANGDDGDWYGAWL
jgi:hypothetical protein